MFYRANFSNFATMTSKANIQGKNPINPTAAQTSADLRQKFTDFMNQRGMRKTPERFEILERVGRMSAHFEIDDLYELMEKEGYHVSKTTVYNTVELLCSCGILRKLMFDASRARYELTTANHLHLVCNVCGSIVEIDAREQLYPLEQMKFPRFRPANFSTVVYGICSKCSRKLTIKTNNKSNLKNHG